MKQQKKDEAVSPVVGVMLMLVVTIIIAAVVAAFAGGLSSSVEKTPTIAFDVSMDDNGLLLSCTGADTTLVYGDDFFIRINHPQDLDVYTENLNISRTTSGANTGFKPGNAIYYSFSDLCSAYSDLDKNTYGNNGNNGKCWTWGGSNGATIGLPVKVQLVSPNGQLIAQATGKCTRTN